MTLQAKCVNTILQKWQNWEKRSLWYICYFTHIRENLSLFLSHCWCPCQLLLVINILAHSNNFAIQSLPHPSQQYLMWLITGINDHFLRRNLEITCDFWVLTRQPASKKAELRFSGTLYLSLKFTEYQVGSWRIIWSKISCQKHSLDKMAQHPLESEQCGGMFHFPGKNIPMAECCGKFPSWI